VQAALAVAGAVVLAAEVGIPLPVPVDLVLIALGERARAGTVPLAVVVVATEILVIVGTTALFVVSRRIGDAVLERVSTRERLGPRLERVRRRAERLGVRSFAIGRAVPGLRTITAVVAGASSSSPVPALVALVVGSTIFVQAHIALGFAAGGAARGALDRAPLALIAVLVLLAAVGALARALRRRRAGGYRAWSEGACPACVAADVSMWAKADDVAEVRARRGRR
jgi:membrane-associated protein